MRAARARLLAPALAAVVVAALLAGCAEAPPAACADEGACLPAAATEAPKLSARAVLDEVKRFSEAHPYRQSGTPAHEAARDDLTTGFQAAGLEVIRQPFPSQLTSGVEYDGENVIGIKWGHDRSDWIVVGAHYDVTETAVHGAYDDGSGTAIMAKLAEAFAPLETQRTILFIAFDQEELGLVGSKAFLRSLDEGTFPHPGNVTAMLDLDMVGITYPHPARLCVWENSDTLRAWLGEAGNATAMPYGHFDFRTPLAGSSDGAAFIASHIPTAYLWSDWDEYILPDGTPMPYPGGYVGAYPWWHKMDTYETMVVSAGDEATLEAGFQTVLDITSPFVLRMANGPEPDVAE